jgi:hypothetical protein
MARCQHCEEELRASETDRCFWCKEAEAGRRGVPLRRPKQTRELRPGGGK